jgi:cryptochrome
VEDARARRKGSFPEQYIWSTMTEIYWFQHDLRVRDNPALQAHCRARKLLLVYFWPENRPWCNVTGMGGQRRRFLLESLHALREELLPWGQNLLVLQGRPELQLPALVEKTGAGLVGTSRSAGYFERTTLERVAVALPVPLKVHAGNTLFSRDTLPFELQQMPVQFTPFKRQLDAVEVAHPLGSPPRVPLPPPVTFAPLDSPAENPPISLPLKGGSAAGHRRLRQWTLGSHGIAKYQETRNCLDGLAGSSTLSPWLANGCLSAREVAAAIRNYEASFGANASTQWMMDELLWREFFYWRALQDDIALFRPGGRRVKLHRCTFEPRNFARWCQGDTSYPLVNAVMRQLLATGWMSNRGRQIAASCLVHELGIDWRYGAAFFEKHLVDYDVASNYGNWQYLAGVGADPRGGRHFDLEK